MENRIYQIRERILLSDTAGAAKVLQGALKKHGRAPPLLAVASLLELHRLNVGGANEYWAELNKATAGTSSPDTSTVVAVPSSLGNDDMVHSLWQRLQDVVSVAVVAGAAHDGRHGDVEARAFAERLLAQEAFLLGALRCHDSPGSAAAADAQARVALAVRANDWAAAASAVGRQARLAQGARQWHLQAVQAVAMLARLPAPLGAADLGPVVESDAPKAALILRLVTTLLTKALEAAPATLGTQQASVRDSLVSEVVLVLLETLERDGEADVALATLFDEQGKPVHPMRAVDHPWEASRAYARLLRRAGKADVALARYEAIVRAHPDDWIAWQLVALCAHTAAAADGTSDARAAAAARVAALAASIDAPKLRGPHLAELSASLLADEPDAAAVADQVHRHWSAFGGKPSFVNDVLQATRSLDPQALLDCLDAGAAPADGDCKAGLAWLQRVRCRAEVQQLLSTRLAATSDAWATLAVEAAARARDAAALASRYPKVYEYMESPVAGDDLLVVASTWLRGVGRLRDSSAAHVDALCVAMDPLLRNEWNFALRASVAECAVELGAGLLVRESWKRLDLRHAMLDSLAAPTFSNALFRLGFWTETRDLAEAHKSFVFNAASQTHRAVEGCFAQCTLTKVRELSEFLDRLRDSAAFAESIRHSLLCDLLAVGDVSLTAGSLLELLARISHVALGDTVSHLCVNDDTHALNLVRAVERGLALPARPDSLLALTEEQASRTAASALTTGSNVRRAVGPLRASRLQLQTHLLRVLPALARDLPPAEATAAGAAKRPSFGDHVVLAEAVAAFQQAVTEVAAARAAETEAGGAFAALQGRGEAHDEAGYAELGQAFAVAAAVAAAVRVGDAAAYEAAAASVAAAATSSFVALAGQLRSAVDAFVGGTGTPDGRALARLGVLLGVPLRCATIALGLAAQAMPVRAKKLGAPFKAIRATVQEAHDALAGACTHVVDSLTPVVDHKGEPWPLPADTVLASARTDKAVQTVAAELTNSWRESARRLRDSTRTTSKLLRSAFAA
uniref:Uncharacterized protein n=1 Tax=Sexangularia sp. CB-2014 TaxID=1486929 RepID=A0A7S1VG10_9EUKA|mmetsp:Transcript_2884/g.9402  ORF Transcript_2884/g.9402 Transcript_2884/m.9402 type:complete len:1030 (+) Transcript_2884:68-3157(+)